MERLLTRSLVDSLGGYYADGLPVTSVYLGLTPSTEHRREAMNRLKDLVSANWDRVLSGRSRKEKATLEGDVKAFMEFLGKMHTVDVTGLAMYSCSAKKYFETVGVAVPFRPEVIVADRPAIAPLITALDEFKRIAVCLVDRRGAKLYEYFMGRIEEVRVFSDDVPSRLKFGGWGGYEEGRMQRHVLAHEYAHFKNVAEVLFEQFKLRGFEWLFLGIKPDAREEMERTLQTYVRERLKGYVDLGVQAPVSRIRKLVSEAAERMKAEENGKYAQRLVQTASSSGLAVTGFKKTLEAINMADVSTLLVRQGIAQKGVVCEKCGTLGLKRSDCKICGNGMTATDAIVDKAEAAALAQGAVVKHISTDSALDKYEGIGAFIRYPLKSGGA